MRSDTSTTPAHLDSFGHLAPVPPVSSELLRRRARSGGCVAHRLPPAVVVAHTLVDHDRLDDPHEHR